jgi:uncharacterized protein (TIGR02186 family)
MKTAINCAALIVALAGSLAPAAAQDQVQVTEPVPREEVQSEISTREIAIQSNFTGIEILIYGSVDFSQAGTPDTGKYDVIVVIRSPAEPLVMRRKERVAGIWVNGPGRVYPSVPGFYAVSSTRPFRAIASDETLKKLGIGFTNLDFGRPAAGSPDEETFRTALIRLKVKQQLFQEHDDAVSFVGRSLFKTTVALPVKVPIGRYTSDIYLFRDGKIITVNQSTLEVTKVGFEGLVYRFAFAYPFLYGVFAVVIAVLAGLTGWYVFRRE